MRQNFRSTRPTLRVIALAAAMAAFAGPARPVPVTWVGANNGYWDIGSNWSAPLASGSVLDLGGFNTELRSGYWTLASMSGSGTLTLSGSPFGVLNVGGISSIGGLQLKGAQLVVAGSLSAKGPSSWTSTLITGSGSVTFEDDLTLSGSASHSLSTGTLNLNGVTTWTNVGGGGALVAEYGATLNNTGAFLDQTSSSAGITYNSTHGARATFNNNGTFRKSSATTTNLDAVFNNSGWVYVDAGTLTLAGGGSSTNGHFNVASGTTLNLNGGFALNSASFTGAGLTQISSADITGTVAVGSALSLNGGTIGGTGALIANGASTWAGSGMTSTGSTVFNGALTLNGSGTRVVTQRSIGLAGTSTWTAGDFSMGGGATLTNSGSFLDQTAAAASINNGQGGALSKFVNTGTFTKSGATTTTIGVFMQNDKPVGTGGVLNVSAGTLKLAAGGSSDHASFNVASGATLNFSGGIYTMTSSTFNVVNGGVVQVTGATVNKLEPTVFADGTLSVSSGSFNAGNGLTLGNLILSGGTLSSTGDVSISNRVTWTGGSLVAGATGTVINAGNGFQDQNASDALIASAFRNIGTAYAKSGAGTTHITGAFDNTTGGGSTSTLELSAGTLSLDGGGQSTTGAFNVGAAATLNFGGSAAFALNNTQLNNSGTVKVSGAGVTTTDARTLAGTLEVSAGSFKAGGALTTNHLKLSGGTVGSTLASSGGTLTLGGTTTWSGGSFAVGSSAVLTNNGSFLDQNTGNASIPSGSGNFINNGSYTKSGSGTTTVNRKFVNFGALQASAGTLILAGGLDATNYNPATLTLLNKGSYSVTGVLQFAGAITTNATSLTLDGPNALIRNSSNSANALASLASNTATGNLSLGNTTLVSTPVSGTFSNAGIADLRTGGSFKAIGRISNLAGAQVLMHGGSLTSTTGLNNAGSISGFGQISGPLTNASNLVASGGTLTLDALSNSCVVVDACVVGIAADGGLVANSFSNSALGLVQMSGGSLTGTTGLSNAGKLSGFGQINGLLTNTGTLLPGSGTLTVEALSNSGVVGIATGSNLVATSSFSNLVAGQVQMSGGSVGGTTTLNNTGTLSGFGTVNAPVSNAGIVLANGSILELKALSNYNAATNTLSGGSYQLSGAGILKLPGADIRANAASIQFDGSTSAIRSDDATQSALRNLATNAAGGSFALLNGASFSTSTFSNSGLLSISGASSSFTATNSFSNTGSGQVVMAGGSFKGNWQSNAGTVSGFGTIIPKLNNTGSLQATAGGTLTLTAGLNNLSGALATLTLTGGSYLASGGGKLLIPQNSKIVTNAASITLSGPGSDIQAVGAGYSALQGLATNAAGASFSLKDGAIFGTAAPVFSNSGLVTADLNSSFSASSFKNLAGAQVQLSGGHLNGSFLVNQGTILGFGLIASSLDNGGGTVRASGGTLELGNVMQFSNGTLTGGSYVVDAGAKLVFGSGGSISKSNADIQLNGLGASIFGGGIDLRSLSQNQASGRLTLAGGASVAGGGNGFSNQGVMAINGEASSFTTSLGFTNAVSGQLTLAGGKLNSTFLWPLSNQGTTSGFGTIALPVNNTSTGLLQAIGGTLELSGGLGNLSGTTLNSYGRYVVSGGGRLLIPGASIVTNLANVTLDGLGSDIRSSSVTSALQNFATNQGSFSVKNGAVFSLAGDFTNSGALAIADTGSSFSARVFTNSATRTVELSGGSLIANSLNNSGTLSGYGTIQLAQSNNIGSGIIQAKGGTLSLPGGLQAANASIVVDSGATLFLGAPSKVGTLTINSTGYLQLTHSIEVSTDYIYANSGGSNPWARTSHGVVGSGDSQLMITSDDYHWESGRLVLPAMRVGHGAATATYTLSNVGTSGPTQRPYFSASSLTNPALTGSGATLDQAIAPLPLNGPGQTFSLNFNPTYSQAMKSQSLWIQTNFQNKISMAFEIVGNAYAPAVAKLNTPAKLDFGIVRVGDAATRMVSVSNTATGELTDQLHATLSGGGAHFSTGTTALVAAGASADLGVTLDTATAGLFTGVGSLGLASRNGEMSDLALSGEEVSFIAQVNNLAVAALAKTGGGGSFGVVDGHYVLNFGTLTLGSNGIVTALSLSNAAQGTADALAGSFSSLVPGGAFTLSGAADFANLQAGEALSGLKIRFDTASLGSFDQVLTLSTLSTNASDPLGRALGNVELHLQGSVTAVPEPGGWLMMAGGLLWLGGVGRRRLQNRRV
ncbi:choice-of-anchor D domain-containing protein [Roseateles sp. P5_E7]